MSDIVERVAEAIWRADHRAGEPESWVACAYPNYYRMLARAAVDALQLTEETAWMGDPWGEGESLSEYSCGCPRINDPVDRQDYNIPVSRLVSPWLAEEGK